MAPHDRSDGDKAWTPSTLTRPKLGFNPATPQYEAGMRIDPPVSVPTAAKQRPAADRSRRAAAGTSGGAARIPRIVGLPEIRMHGAVRVFQQVGLAEDDGAGLLQVAHQPGIGLRQAWAAGARGEGGWNACHVDQVLDRDRHAVQWTAIANRFELARRAFRPGKAFRFHHRDQAVERRIEFGDPIQQPATTSTVESDRSGRPPPALRSRKSACRAPCLSPARDRLACLRVRRHGFAEQLP